MATRDENQARETGATRPGLAGDSGGNGQQQVRTREGPQSQGAEGENRSMSRRPGRRDLASSSSNPFESIWQLSRDMDRLMGSIFRGNLAPAFGPPFRSQQGFSEASAALWSPRIDVEQRGDSLIVSADLPGVRKEDVQIEVSQDGLTLSGERREEHEAGGEAAGYRSVERTYGSFYRTVPLPDTVNREQLKASMRDGVLRITIPFDEKAKPRRVQIES
jgi:HSP20 family protein